jgi:flagellar hook-length control protein FliK
VENQDQGLDQTNLTDQASMKSLGEKSDTTRQQLFENLMSKSAANNDKSQLSESLLQNNALSGTQIKEQMGSPVASAPVSAYQASANALNASAAAGSSNYIGAYPGKSGWDQAIGQKVVWMVGAGEQSATLNLNPPDLGPLQVVINVNNDKADTTFISQNVEVRKALEEGMSTLRDMMGQAGVELGQTNVSTQSQAQQNFEQASKNAGQSFAGSGTSNQAPEKVLSSTVVTRAANGLVDTFA